MMVYEVQTEVFNGPLAVLLDLIEKRKLLINDISLSKVTDDYIEYVKSIEELPMSDSANFILIASTLLLIKSKSLLPSLEITDEEKGSMDDLERRLKMYQVVRSTNALLQERYNSNNLYSASKRRQEGVFFAPDASMTLGSLLEALKSVFQELPKIEELPKVIVKKVASLEETISSLTTRIKSSLKLGFREFSGYGKAEKVDVIVSFLAMLELVKQGILHVVQESRHHDIQMESEDVGVPHYG